LQRQHSDKTQAKEKKGQPGEKPGILAVSTGGTKRRQASVKEKKVEEKALAQGNIVKSNDGEKERHWKKAWARTNELSETGEGRTERAEEGVRRLGSRSESASPRFRQRRDGKH